MIQQSQTQINLRGLVLGGMLIGALGVLDDLVITQASVVFELHQLDPGMRLRDLYRRAMRVGQDHVAATVNTLVLAYAGALLGLLARWNLVKLRIDEQRCTECNRCTEVCDDDAIHFDVPLETIHERRVGAVIVATGVDIVTRSAEEIGFGGHPDIVTTAEKLHLACHAQLACQAAEAPLPLHVTEQREERSEERRVGKECRSRWSPYH